MVKQFSSQVIRKGDRQAIPLSQRALDLSDLEVGDRVNLTIEKESILVTKKKSPLKEKIRAFYQAGGTYEEGLIDYGETAGEEW